MKKLFLPLLMAICLMVVGCTAAQNGNGPNNTAPSVPGEIPQNDESSQLAQLLSDSFLEDWQALEDISMRQDLVEVFASDCVEGVDQTVFFVYPEYKTCRALIYGVTGDQVKRIGEISCGFTFMLSRADGGMIRTTKTLMGAHTSEVNDTYYRISSEGIEQELSLSTLFADEEVTGYCLYTDGESSEMDAQDYAAQKETADAAFSDPTVMDLDIDEDYRLDYGYDLSDTAGLAAFIQSRLIQ